MGGQSGLGQNLYVGGYNLSSDVGAINDAGGPRPSLPVTALNASGVERLLGLGDGHISFNTWFDDGTNLSHTALSSLPTTDTQALYVAGTAAGDKAAGLVCKQVGYNWSRNNDGSLQGTIECVSSSGNPLEWGEMLTSATDTHTGATNGTSRDDTAQTTGGLRAYLQVFALTGTNVVVTIEESNDNGSGDAWTAKLAFTSVTSVPGKERKTGTGTVERYLRLATSGTFSSAEFAVMTARGTANDDVPLA